jgi:predicted transcriptional regulator
VIDQLEQEVDMIERHLDVLRMVLENEPIGILKMSNETGHPHHKIRYSLRVLEEASLIEPTSQGAATTDETSEFVAGLDGRIDDITTTVEEMSIDNAVESSS